MFLNQFFRGEMKYRNWFVEIIRVLLRKNKLKFNFLDSKTSQLAYFLTTFLARRY